MELGFGKKTVYYDASKSNIIGVLESTKNDIKPLKEILEKSILRPIGKPRLKELLQKNKPRDLVVIVSDITRSIADYDKILSFLATEIIDAGVDEKNVEFVVALGTHKKHTPEENKALFGELLADFNFSFHDCHKNLMTIGKTSSGLEVQVNKRVKAADFVMATGRINFHYLAGFSGGRKSILPGIASYETIRGNHCKLKRAGVAPGKIESNIIAQEMDEAAELFKVDYLMNVIEDDEKHVTKAFCGDIVHAHKKGIERFKAEHMSRITNQADCVIVSAGGYPKDRTLFSSHKVLNNIARAVHKGGSIILVAECSDGLGNPEFVKYMLDNNIEELLHYPEAKIEIGGHRAFQTSKLLKDYKIYVVSKLDSSLMSQMHFTPVKDVDSAVDQAKKDHGQELKIYIVPDGRSIVATLNGMC
jgi:nickel-dependent lactate racemase